MTKQTKPLKASLTPPFHPFKMLPWTIQRGGKLLHTAIATKKDLSSPTTFTFLFNLLSITKTSIHNWFLLEFHGDLLDIMHLQEFSKPFGLILYNHLENEMEESHYFMKQNFYGVLMKIVCLIESSFIRTVITMTVIRVKWHNVPHGQL